jgi:hypothetical protein
MVAPEDPAVADARSRLDAALPRLSAAAGAEMVGIVGSHDPLAAVQDALNLPGRSHRGCASLRSATTYDRSVYQCFRSTSSSSRPRSEPRSC